MIYEIFNNYFGDFLNVIDLTYDTLQTRMKKYLHRYNNLNIHPYKCHIITLKSKQLLSYVNTLSNLDDKITFLESYNTMLNNVCKKLYIRFNPQMIYSFNDEIHLVFYYKETNNIYNGNIHKLLTTFTSYTSICMLKELLNNSININFEYYAKIVEFNEDYETLNYLIWRQFDCKRNIMTLLYKCLKYNDILDGGYSNIEKMKLEDIMLDFSKNQSVNNNLLTGNILKKQIYYVSKEDLQKDLQKDLVTRKNILVEHFYLADNFTENMQKYIKNKIL